MAQVRPRDKFVLHVAHQLFVQTLVVVGSWMVILEAKYATQ